MRAGDATLVERLVRFRPRLLALSLLMGFGPLLFFGAWGYQIVNGIGVAGINRPVFWGFYIVNFVFWIGISHAGTLISAILRVTGAEWRRPVTRCAEAVTAFALAIGGLFPIIHLGRPDRMLWMMPIPNDRGLWPNFRSPLIWDMAAISAYILGSVLYLYLPMIPDMALIRDRAAGLRRRIAAVLSLGWSGTPRQWRSLEAGIKSMALVIIPLAVSVHTIVSWDFAVTQAPMWNSTIFGPYFVVGAIYSGIAMLMIAMALLRRGMHLGEWLSDKVFSNLALLFLAMAMFWGYFTFGEHLIVWYANETSEARVLWTRFNGDFALPFWFMIVVNFVIPMAVLPFRWGRKPLPVALVSVGVLVGMWLERFLIVIPTLELPRLAYTLGSYTPSIVEIAIAVGAAGTFVFLYLVFTQAVPIISIWEVRERSGAGEIEAAAESLHDSGHGPLEAALGDEAAATAAVERLTAAGIDRASIEIRSSVPLHAPSLQPPGRSRVSVFAILGGIGGGALALLVAVATTKAYPVITGHMPLIAFPPMVIIAFEGIALGAVISTVGSLLIEGGILGRRKKGALDSRVSAGEIVVRVDCGAEMRASAAAALAESR